MDMCPQFPVAPLALDPKPQICKDTLKPERQACRRMRGTWSASWRKRPDFVRLGLGVQGFAARFLGLRFRLLLPKLAHQTPKEGLCVRHLGIQRDVWVSGFRG